MKVHSSGQPSNKPAVGARANGDDSKSVLSGSAVRHFAPTVYLIVMAVAGMSMLGWLLDIEILRVVLSGLASMKFNTALCFILLALAGMLSRTSSNSTSPFIYRLCVLAVALISALTLLQYIADVDVGIDELLVRDSATTANAFPGRPSAGTALAFLVLCLARWFAMKRKFKLMQLLSSGVFLLGVLAVLGYLFDVGSLYSFTMLSTMALHTALAFIFLAAALLTESLEYGYLRIFGSPSVGGVAVRKLLPWVVLMPFALTGAVLGGEHFFGYETHFGLFVLAILSAAILTIAVYRIGRLLQFIQLSNQRIEMNERLMQERIDRMEYIESMGLVAGGVAHDFNNMLLPIMWATEQAQSELSPEDPLFENLETIRKSSEKAATLVARMMQLGKGQDVKMEYLNLNVVVMDFIDILRSVVKSKCSLHVDLEVGLYSMVADKRQLEQVMLNLVTNAFHAIDQHGEIVIRTTSAYINSVRDSSTPQELHPGQYVVLSVTDNGCGMDRKTLGRVLEPFYTTKEQGIGHGLGLPTVNKFARRHAGTLRIVSEEGTGTVVEVFLPATRITKVRQAARNQVTSAGMLQLRELVQGERVRVSPMRSG